VVERDMEGDLLDQRGIVTRISQIFDQNCAKTIGR